MLTQYLVNISEKFFPYSIEEFKRDTLEYDLERNFSLLPEAIINVIPSRLKVPRFYDYKLPKIILPKLRKVIPVPPCRGLDYYRKN